MSASEIDARHKVTRILNAVRKGEVLDNHALIRAVYDELRQIAAAKMAREKARHTLQGTAQEHEAWLRLGDGIFEKRAHFFAAAEAMWRILVERARRKISLKRGGGADHVAIDKIEIPENARDDDEMLAVNDALNRLVQHGPRKAELVKLRYFSGFFQIQKKRPKFSESLCGPQRETGTLRVPGCTEKYGAVNSFAKIAATGDG